MCNRNCEWEKENGKPCNKNPKPWTGLCMSQNKKNLLNSFPMNNEDEYFKRFSEQDLVDINGLAKAFKIKKSFIAKDISLNVCTFLQSKGHSVKLVHGDYEINHPVNSK